MRFKIKVLRQLFFTAFLMFCSYHEIFSQEADSSKVKQQGLYIGLILGSSQSQINNEGILTVSDLHSGKKNNLMGTLEIGYFFSDYIGLSSGIGFISANGQVTLNSYQYKFNTTDSENETYERQVTGSNIREVQNIGFLSVPICLNIRLPFNKKIGFFLQTGIDVAIPFIKNYHSSGTFTYEGYYPAYNVLLENLPAYGFPSNAGIVTDGKLKLKPLCFDAIATAGIDFHIQKKMQIAIAAFYSQSLSNISAYTLPEKFQLSTDVNQINSLMEGSGKATVQSMGLKITLRYFLTKY